MKNVNVVALSAALFLVGCADAAPDAQTTTAAISGASDGAIFELFGSTVTFDTPDVGPDMLRANALVTCLPNHATKGFECTLDTYWAWRDETSEGTHFPAGVTSYVKTGADADLLYAAMGSMPDLGADGSVAELGAKRAILDCVATAVFPKQGRFSPASEAKCETLPTVTGEAQGFEWTDEVHAIAGADAATLFDVLGGIATESSEQGGTVRRAEITSYDYTKDAAPGFPPYALWIGQTEHDGDVASRAWTALSTIPESAGFGKRGLLTCLERGASVTCSLRRPS